MKLSRLRRYCADKLAEGAIERPFYAADLIAAKALNIEKALLITKNDDEVEACVCESILSMTEARLRRVPLSYILCEAEFYGRPFKVGEGCLIPRPETELLVEEILNVCPDGGKFADWCTGSGCIAVTLLLENPAYIGIGVDSSSKALEWAKSNRDMYGLGDRLCLIKNRDPSECAVEPDSLDFITANPPYIPSREIPGIMADVREYEPLEALDGGEDGVSIYRMLFASLPEMLKTGGVACFETAGDGQASILIDMAPQSFILENKIYDYNGILRHLTWRKE